MAEFAVTMTARLMVLAYVVRLCADIAGWPEVADQRSRREKTVRWIWTLGCVVCLLHVGAAFQFVHGWSHTAAYAHTAEQTAAVTGWRWGGGLWVNYAFTLWWVLDVVWNWRRGLDRLPRDYVIGMHLVVGFLMFNATVVFGPVWWRWVALPIVGILIFLARGRCRQNA
ncbi:MAG: hypothetical protein KDA86_05365 [Planctomycetaceae bacterium]|nr:hypothetical protein [Planctomycetaceae bacterium]